MHAGRTGGAGRASSSGRRGRARAPHVRAQRAENSKSKPALQERHRGSRQLPRGPRSSRGRRSPTSAHAGPGPAGKRPSSLYRLSCLHPGLLQPVAQSKLLEALSAALNTKGQRMGQALLGSRGSYWPAGKNQAWRLPAVSTRACAQPCPPKPARREPRGQSCLPGQQLCSQALARGSPLSQAGARGERSRSTPCPSAQTSIRWHRISPHPSQQQPGPAQGSGLQPPGNTHTCNSPAANMSKGREAPVLGAAPAPEAGRPADRTRWQSPRQPQAKEQLSPRRTPPPGLGPCHEGTRHPATRLPRYQARGAAASLQGARPHQGHAQPAWLGSAPTFLRTH